MNLVVRRLLTALAATLCAAALPAAAAFAADAPPYTDGDAKGSLTLCDASGHEVRSGYVDAIPMFAYAISSTRAPSPYDQHTDVKGVRGRPAAILAAAQPRQGYPAGDWSGQLIGGSSLFTNPDHPVAVLSRGDYTLRQFLQAFPARWDGYVELRMRFKAPQQPTSDSYAAADIRVTGDVWRLARGGGGSCGAGTATSVEQLLVPRAYAGGNKPSTGPDSLTVGLAAAQAQAVAPPRPGQTSLPSSVPSAAAAGGSSATPGSPSTAEAGVDHRSGSSSQGPLVALGVLILAVLGGAGWWAGRRRLNSR